ncbi:hypothetical protein EVAR_90380_1 [Eumeta japonica]|uniref:Uncharacterized protein n=1 Tax=Eumeta variegata TaxID=151549 RepID=A0A4C1YCJ4_EUMVA|nr:hypothetical protein EVAR_90380_1 [Eumeta japonica]
MATQNGQPGRAAPLYLTVAVVMVQARHGKLQMDVIGKTVGAVSADATGDLLSDTTSILSNLTSLTSIESILLAATALTYLAPD